MASKLSGTTLPPRSDFTNIVEIEPLPAANATQSASVDRTQIATVAVAFCYTTFVIYFAAHIQAASIARCVDFELGVLRICDLWLRTRQNLLLSLLTWAAGGPSASSCSSFSKSK